MKKWQLWTWSIVASLLFFLGSLSVAWAMPGQSTLNQSIPTRTPLPAPTARLSESENPLAIPGTDPAGVDPAIPGAPGTARSAPQSGGALPAQWPATPQTADMPLPTLAPGKSAPEQTPMINAPEATPELASDGSPATLGNLPAQRDSSRDGSWLSLLFPDAKSPQTSFFTSLVGGILLTLGIVILFLMGQRRAK